MDKAVLVIDMPESCDKCPLLLRHEEERCCMPEGRNSFTTKPSWCPLRPLPEKYDLMSSSVTFDWDFESGYNKCIDEILGEK